MTEIFDIDVIFCIKSLLERKNSVHPVGVVANLVHAVRLPCPDIGRNEVQHLESLFLCPFRNAEVESGVIDKH